MILINEERLWGLGIIILLMAMWWFSYLINQRTYKKQDYAYFVEDDIIAREDIKK